MVSALKNRRFGWHSGALHAKAVTISPSTTPNSTTFNLGAPATTAGSGLRIGTSYNAAGAPVGIYFDDGGVALTTWGEGFTVGTVVTANSTGAAQTGWPYTAFFYTDVQSNITSAVNQHWTVLMTNFSIASGKTLDGFDSCGVSSHHASIDINGTLAAGTTIANISFGGNSPGTISGTWVPLHVRSVTGTMTAFLKIETGSGVYTATPVTGGTSQYLKVLIGAVPYTIEMTKAS